MFDQSIQRVGFCCKYVEPNRQQSKKQLKEAEQPLNTRTTTVQWLSQQDRSVAEQRLWDLMEHNIESFRRLVEYAGNQEPNCRMVRLSSDCLPMYTQPTWRYFWQQRAVGDSLERLFSTVGETARRLGVRLSFHPGQFCCIVSDSDDVVTRSLEELEYHAGMAAMMGFAREWQDFKINIHLSGRRGIAGFDSAWQQMSPELRNCLTLENDEYQMGVEDLVTLKDRVAIVMDIHHEWIKTEQYVSPTEDKVQAVVDSWRGVRPVLHYSYSRDEHLPTGFKHKTLPDMKLLLAQGHKKGKLRAHSDFYPNRAANQWAFSFADQFDIQLESKMKNLAQQQFFQEQTARRATT